MLKARIVAAALTAGIAFGGAFGLLPNSSIAPVKAAAGGPVILDGTDSSLHGSVDDSNNPQRSWLYMQKAIEALFSAIPAGYAAVDNGKIAVIGAEDSEETGDNCGGAAHYIGAKLGKTVDFYKGATAISGLLTQLAAGTNNYSVVWVVEQDWASNCLDNGGDDSESDALVANAAAIAAHVNRGGGFFQNTNHGYSHSGASSYRWLSALFPTIQVNNGSGSTPDFTPAGSSLFGGISSDNIHNPWHSYFTDTTGTLPLQVLALQAGCGAGGDSFMPTVDGVTGCAVIIGGASVTLPSAIDVSVAPFAEVGSEVCATVTVKEPIEGVLTPKVGASVTWAVTGGHSKSSSGTTNSDGQATYCYTVTTEGTDTVTATSGSDSADGTITWRKMPTTASGKVIVPAPATTNAPVASNFVSDPETLDLSSEYIDLKPVGDVTEVGDVPFGDAQYGETSILTGTTVQFSTDFFTEGDCLKGYFQLPNGTWINLGNGIKPGTELVLDPMEFKSVGRYEIDLTTVTCVGSAGGRFGADLRGKILGLGGMSHVGRLITAGVTPSFGANTSRYVINVGTTLPETNRGGSVPMILLIVLAGLTAVAGVKLVRGHGLLEE